MAGILLIIEGFGTGGGRQQCARGNNGYGNVVPRLLGGRDFDIYFIRRIHCGRVPFGDVVLKNNNNDMTVTHGYRPTSVNMTEYLVVCLLMSRLPEFGK